MIPSKDANTHQKSVELERIILFSDVVCGVAIALLALEIKVPSVAPGLPLHRYLSELAPFSREFGALLLSFVFIGLCWSCHLRVFRFLHQYDDQVIKRNLTFLFFIICIPFTSSGVAHALPGHGLPIYLYVFNLAAAFSSIYWLFRYILRSRPSLTVPGHHMDKETLYRQLKYNTIAMTVAVVVITGMDLLQPSDMRVRLAGYLLLPLAFIISQYKLKHFKRYTLRPVID